MSKIKNGGLDQYGAEPFEQQQFGPAGLEGVKLLFMATNFLKHLVDFWEKHWEMTVLYDKVLGGPVFCGSRCINNSTS